MSKLTPKIFLTAFVRGLSALGATSLTYVLAGQLSASEFSEFFGWLSWALVLSLILRFGGDKIVIKNILNHDEAGFKNVVNSQGLIAVIAIFVTLAWYLSIELSSNNLGFVFDPELVMFSLLMVVAYYIAAIFIGVGSTAVACLVQVGFVQFIAAVIIVGNPYANFTADGSKILILLIYLGVMTLVCRKAYQSIKQCEWKEISKISPIFADAASIWKSRVRFFVVGIGANFQAIGMYAIVVLFLSDADFLTFRYFERIAAFASIVVVFQGVILPTFIFRGEGTQFSKVVLRKLAISITISGCFAVLIGLGLLVCKVLFTDVFTVSISTNLFVLLILTHCVISISAPLSFVLTLSEFEQLVFKIQTCYIIFAMISMYTSYLYGGLELMIASLLLIQILRLFMLISIPIYANRKLRLVTND